MFRYSKLLLCLALVMVFALNMVSSVIAASYDKNGELISLASKISSSKLNTHSLNLFEQGPDGEWTFKLFTEEGATRPSEIKRYDGNGCIVGSVSYSTGGSVMHTEKYQYSPVCTETLPSDPAAFATGANIKKNA